MFNKNKKKNNQKPQPQKQVIQPETKVEEQKEQMPDSIVKKAGLTEQCNAMKVIIIEQAKLISVGKVRNVFELEKAARKLTALEQEIVKIDEEEFNRLQESNN